MTGIGIVLNPHSRSNRRNPERIDRLSFIVGDQGSCHATQSIPDLRDVAEDFARREVEVLGISGGDGTIHHTLSAFLDVYGDRPFPKVALLRGGTVNNVANAVGIKGDPESVLSRLILHYHEGRPLETTPVHCLKINDKSGFLWGNGLISTFMQEYAKLGERGAPAVAALATRCFFSALFHTSYMLDLGKRFDAKVIVDGAEWPFQNYTLVNAGTVEPYGFGVKPFYRAREKPGHFHVFGLAMTPRQLLGALPNSMLSRPLHPEDYIDALAKEVIIECAEPITHMIDGEVYPDTDRIHLRCGPALQMVVA